MADYDEIAERLGQWVADRLVGLNSRRGPSEEYEWPEEVVEWVDRLPGPEDARTSDDPDADDAAPPVVVGTLITQLNGITYEGNSPGEFELTYPEHNETDVDLSTTLEWTESKRTDSYDVEIASDSYFEMPVHKEEYVGDNFFDIPDELLHEGETYFWRVTAFSKHGQELCKQGHACFTTKKEDDSSAKGGKAPRRKKKTAKRRTKKKKSKKRR